MMAGLATSSHQAAGSKLWRLIQWRLVRGRLGRNKGRSQGVKASPDRGRLGCCRLGWSRLNQDGLDRDWNR